MTSAVHTPRLKENNALAMVATECAATGTGLQVEMRAGPVPAQVVEKPVFAPRKRLATG
ncbi:MAG: glycine cleavage T C-terminal barrel domain-containing protein [Sneathiellaceae bacterium]